MFCYVTEYVHKRVTSLSVKIFSHNYVIMGSRGVQSTNILSLISQKRKIVYGNKNEKMLKIKYCIVSLLFTDINFVDKMKITI